MKSVILIILPLLIWIIKLTYKRILDVITIRFAENSNIKELELQNMKVKFK